MSEQFVVILLERFGPWITMLLIVAFAYWKLRGGNLIVLQNGSKKNGKKTTRETEIALKTLRLTNVEKRLNEGDLQMKEHGEAINRIDNNVGILLDRTKERREQWKKN
jgi:hypothetical protein